jgi:hypothetical protein
LAGGVVKELILIRTAAMCRKNLGAKFGFADSDASVIRSQAACRKALAAEADASTKAHTSITEDAALEEVSGLGVRRVLVDKSV